MSQVRSPEQDHIDLEETQGAKIRGTWRNKEITFDISKHLKLTLLDE